MASSPSIDPEAAARFLKSAGRALLACQQFEVAVHQLLAGLAVLHVGNLAPSDAEPIFEGTNKLSAGVLYAKIVPHVQPSAEWFAHVERAIAARNTLIHGFFHRNSVRAMEPLEDAAVESEAEALRQAVVAGYNVIFPVVQELSKHVQSELSRPDGTATGLH
ncbi:MAG: hypothetical protein ACXWJ7_02395 [Caldimonas sp.]